MFSIQKVIHKKKKYTLNINIKLIHFLLDSEAEAELNDKWFVNKINTIHIKKFSCGTVITYA